MKYATPINICIPGYVYYSSKSVSGAASRRGGTIVMLRNCLARQVFNVDISIIDQPVWFQLRCVPAMSCLGFVTYLHLSHHILPISHL